MKTISKELHEKIVNELSSQKPEVYFDYRDKLSEDQIKEILSKGINEFENELWGMNLDYISDIERETTFEVLNGFRDDIEAEIGEMNEVDYGELVDEYRMNYCPPVDMNIKPLLNIDLDAMIIVYSNYDCTNSFDTMETSDYLSQVYQRVKKGVKKSDFMYEHENGAYGGSLFCFAFRCSLLDLVDIKEKVKTGKQVFIPKGTQFGFFSSFHGAGSVFEKETYRDIYLNIKETGEGYYPEYDNIDIIADCEQSYNMDDVYGGISLNEVEIHVK